MKAGAILNQQQVEELESPTQSSERRKEAERDAEIISAMRARPEERKLLFKELVERYHERVYRLVYRIVLSKEDAEDIVQDIFVKIYLSIDDFEGRSSFFTWMYRIAHNMAFDLRRKLKRRGGESLELVEERESLEPLHMSVVHDPHQILDIKQEQTRTNKALLTLSEEHRATILLREVDGLSYEEIADSMGVTKGTVMSRLFYARQKLQNILGFEANEENQRMERLTSNPHVSSAGEGLASKRILKE